MNDETQRLHDTVMDWSLGERLGGEVPPDLGERVRARLADGPRIAAEAAAARSRVRRFAVAAAVVFGVAVVVAVARWERHPEPAAIAPREATAPQDPAPQAPVSNREDIEALPADTRSVVAKGLGDDDVPALRRLRRLETLQLEWLASQGWGGKRLTGVGLDMLAEMPMLRALGLFHQALGGGADLGVLAHLPALEEFTLAVSLADDDALAVLSQMPKLSVLALSGCSRIGRATIERIVRIPTLRSLSLNGCGQLEPDWLEAIGSMAQLERLDLGGIVSHAQRRSTSGDAPGPKSGVTDAVLQALRGLPNLRSLNLANAAITGAGLSGIRELPLVELDLAGIGLRPADFALLPPTLEVLSLRNSAMSYPDLGAALAVLAAATPTLCTLDLRNCEGLHDEDLAALRRLAGLQSLDLSHCPNLTRAAIRELCKFEWLVALTLRGFEFDDEQLARIRAMPNLGRLTTDRGAELLR